MMNETIISEEGTQVIYGLLDEITGHVGFGPIEAPVVEALTLLAVMVKNRAPSEAEIDEKAARIAAMTYQPKSWKNS